MKIIEKIFFVILLLPAFLFAQEEKKVLVEVFTNSHCSVCPAAHNTLSSYDQNSPNADKINYIFYHMVYPYADDPLYQYNKSDSDGRNIFYNPSSSTPVAFFDGVKQQNNYSSWSLILDGLVSLQSPFKILLTGIMGNNEMNLSAEITQSGSIPDENLVINFVAVENVNYQGRNGISNHKNVMREMVTSPTGDTFSISMGETKYVDKIVTIAESMIPENVGVVVFIQSSSSKAVYQSEYISYNDLSMTTDIKSRGLEIPGEYSLEQNYPNPFNPSTIINYSISEPEQVVLKVFNILGKEIKTLVNENQFPGKYEITFNAENLSGGIYIYKLQAGDYIQTRKMIFLK
jgi:thiol-disulfide isomerase/thioredoxin